MQGPAYPQMPFLGQMLPLLCSLHWKSRTLKLHFPASVSWLWLVLAIGTFCVSILGKLLPSLFPWLCLEGGGWRVKGETE